MQSQKPYPALAGGVALQQHHYQPNTTNQTPDVAPTTPHTLNFMAHYHMWPTVPTLPLSLYPPSLVRREVVMVVFCSNTERWWCHNKVLMWEVLM